MLIDIDDLKKQLNSTSASEARKAEQEAALLAEQGNLEATELLISAYAEGTPLIRPDRIKEFKYTKMAADLGSDLSRYWLARLQHQSKDYAGAIENAGKAHEKGIPYAATLLAKMMLTGEGQPAKPLDALQILSNTVDKDDNTDAALLLAEVYLEGRHIPRSAQGAYDVLQKMAPTFERSSPALRADYLAFKAESIRLGARPGPGETYETLISQAAELGNQSAIAACGKMKVNALERELDEEWKSIANFRAAGKRWKMFFALGTLTGLVTKSKTSLSASNGRINETSHDWKEARLVSGTGREFTVTIPTNQTMSTGRSYGVVYVGPSDGEEGVPARIYDLETGATIKTDSNPLMKYTFRPIDRLIMLTIATLGPSLYLIFTSDNYGSLSRFLFVFIPVLAIGIKLFMWPFKGYRQALANAGAFFARHRNTLK